MLAGKRILLGVTGSIAAYKSVSFLRLLQKEGAEVRVMMTASATRFVGSETFRTLSRTEVPDAVFSPPQTGDDWIRHIHWAEWADLIVIAPCTANTLAKVVHGISDNVLTAAVMAARCPILLCPVMDGGMFRSPAMQANLEKARSFGFDVLDPASGYLASGLDDEGRMPEPEEIMHHVETFFSRHSKEGGKPWTGRKVLVTAGPTREYIDPVRFISNPSSGKMGWAMAEAARDLGAEVTLLHGKVALPEPEGMISDTFTGTSDLFEKVKKYSDADVVIMVAAVSDYSPAKVFSRKIKKDDEVTALDLERTPDILQWLGGHRRPGQLIIGFAMETDDLEKNAREKLDRKKADWIIANSVAGENEGFESDTNTVMMLSREVTRTLSGKKTELARQILQIVLDNPKASQKV